MNQVSSLVIEAEYLKTVGTSRDEFDNGRLVKRGLSNVQHGSWTTAILIYLYEHGILGKGVVHLLVAKSKYRISDVMVLDSEAPEELIVTHPPLAVFEVLSPDDLWSEIEDKFEDYERMGIPVKILVNPKTRAWKLYLNGEFRIINGPVMIKGEELKLSEVESYLWD